MPKLLNPRWFLLIILLMNNLFILNISFAQNENKNWYFGDGTDGIIFDANNNPIKVSNKFPSVGYEGMVVVNDPFTGDLLFYTDGIKVINKYHTLMTNGSGLLSNYSGSQCVQACRVPGTCDQYYIISNSSYDNVAGSFYYSIADFSGNSNGAISIKNQLIGGPNYHQAMRIIPKSNSNNYWLIGHLYNTAIYHVYEITPSGFVGPVVYNFTNSGRSWAMKFDPNYNKLINLGEGTIKVTIFDFNPMNGILSNEVQLAQNPIQAGWVGNFSPDGSKLYVGITPGYELWQYDFTNSLWTDMNTCCYSHDILTGPNCITYFIRSYNIADPLAQITNANLTAVGNLCGYSQISNPGNFNGEVRRFPEFLVSVPPPIAETDTFMLTSGTILNLYPLSNDSDPQNDPLLIDSILIGPINGTIQVSGDTIIYLAPNTCITLIDSILYSIKDSNCSYDTAYIFVTTIGIPIESLFSYTIDTCDKIVNFFNNSINATSSIWNFDDGTTSTATSPTHVFPDTGWYYVQLLATGPTGCVDSMQLSIHLEEPQYPMAVFSADTTACSMTVSFISGSTNAVSHSWNFGDGGSSNQPNPSYTYGIPGSYLVTLIVSNSCKTDTAIQWVTILPVLLPLSSFTIDTTHCSGIVSFAGNPQNSLINTWHFGDGSTSTLLNPTHLYSAFGSYLVTLISSNNCGNDTASISFTLDMFDLPISHFEATITPCDSTIKFINNSTNDSLSFWMFGDGDTSSQQNPVHTYQGSGVYNVVLISGNGCGSDTLTVPLDLAILAPPLASFSYELLPCSSSVTFINNSTNGYEWIWNFDDGMQSHEENPEHVYNDPGTYEVSLVVNPRSDCQDTIQATFSIDETGVEGLYVPNVFTPNNDGKNDKFVMFIPMMCETFTISIFNRWGQCIFESDDIDKNWDGTYNGTKAPDGVYFYLLKGKKQVLYGTVSLFR